MTTKLIPRSLTPAIRTRVFGVWLSRVGLRPPKLIQSLYPPDLMTRGSPESDFEENQIFTSLIRLLLLSTSHRMVFQHQPVRASRGCYTSFTLPMDRSPVFGSSPADSVAHFALGFPSASPLKGLTLPTKLTPGLIKQKARGQAWGLPPHSPPTACKCAVSGPISLPLQGCF